MKNTLFIIIGIILLSCETKEYTPNPDALRDSALVGTWRNINVPESDSSYIVFTKEGYYGSTSWINNKQITGFTDLDGLWYNINLPDSTAHGEYYNACTSKHWTHSRWSNNDYYKIINNDTLRIGTNKTSTLDDIYIRNRFLLIFEGPYYSGIDSTTQE